MIYKAGFLLFWFTTMLIQAGAQRPETKLNWKLGAQAYTFKQFTLEEALRKMDSCGLTYVECYPGQKIGGNVEGTMDYHMDSSKRKQVLEFFRRKEMIPYSYGVVRPANKEDWVQVFQFARAMGFANIVSEPSESEIPLVSALADEYGINVAIHNHPYPAHYWHPDSVLKVLKGSSKRLGACADIGHWVRSGLDPLECLRKLEGHIFELHCKDLNEKSREAHDVPWGTGVSDIPAIVKELKRQKFSSAILIEYEYHWESNTPEVAQSIKNIRTMIHKL